MSATSGWFSTLGALLVGMSIWQSIEIEGVGFKEKLTELENKTKSLNEMVRTANNKVENLELKNELYMIAMYRPETRTTASLVQENKVGKSDFMNCIGDKLENLSAIINKANEDPYANVVKMSLRRISEMKTKDKVKQYLDANSPDLLDVLNRASQEVCNN